MNDIIGEIAISFRQLADKAINIWDELKELLYESDIDFDEPLHPALRQKTVGSFRLRSQVMLNKPRQMCARSNC